MNKSEISSLQKYLWLDQKLTPESPKYNIGGYAVIDGYVDFNLFKEALSIFSDKHKILKSVFREENGKPFLLINEDEKEFNEGVNFIEKRNKQEILDLIRKDFKKPFNLEEDKKIFKIWLVKISANTFIWYTKLHHLIADGYSFQLLFNEVSTIYNSLLNNDISTYEKINVKEFSNHIEEEVGYYNSSAFFKDKEYWQNKYTVFPELIYHKKYQECNFYDKELYLSEDVLQKMKSLSKEENISVFHILLASFSIVFSKFYFTNQINIGTPVLNRLSRLDRKIFGPFINLLPLQVQLDKDISFLELIKQVKKDIFTMFRHQKFQQAEIIKSLSYKGNRLYDIRISYESFDYQNTFSKFESEIVALSNSSEEDPISVHIMDYNNEGLKFRFDINGSYVPEYIANEFIESLHYILENTSTILNTGVKEIPIINKTQKKEIEKISKGVTRPFKHENFLELWNENVNNFPLNEALRYKEETLNYNKANVKIEKIVGFLNAQGICKGDRVGVLIDRSINIIPVILGVLKSGATYVPIDKTFPEDRIEFIIQDSEIKLLITDDEKITYRFEPTVLVDSVLEQDSQPLLEKVKISKEDEAYIIYTSGSTGKPKGVLIRHESLIDYALTFSEYFKLSDIDCVIQQSSFVFDTSIEEIFPILSIGGKLVISENPKDFHSLLQECSKNHVTLLSTNPFVVQYLNENKGRYKLSLKHIISGGDVLKKEQVNNLLNNIDVYNTYGPTESTVCATYHKVNPKDTTLPIGKPITNRNVFIINNGKLLPKGAVGEIALGGKGLAIGYLNNKTLTDTFFVELDGERVYKTGDVGKWDNQDNVIFLGRKDSQLSFKGYRIEPKEIEQAIKSLNPLIRNCIVTIKELQNNPVLVAYLSGNINVEETSLIKQLKVKLPAYMIPNHVVVLEDFPLNTSGKVDVKQLPLPKKNFIKQEVVLAKTEAEHEITNIWKELLHLDEIDIHTSFFELGGHSLLANQFIGIIREHRKQDISLKEFYEAPTICEVVKVIENKEVSTVFELQKAPEQELYPLSFPQERLWFLDQLNKENKAYYVPRAIKMSGELDISLIEETFTLLIEKHEILRTVFPVIEGVPYQKIVAPYYFHIPLISLVGFSEEEQEQEIHDFILKEGNLDFDLENGPLLRVYILQKSEKNNILVFCEHHLIHDGWTQGILLREFIDTYTKLSHNRNYKLSQLELQFKDFSYWQKEFFNDERLNNHISFWKEKLKGHIPVLPLPQKNKRPNEISGNGELLIKTINEELSDKIRAFSLENNSTLFITMLTAFKITLSKFSNETDICVGTAVANRRLASLDNMLGMIINTMALRTKLDNNDSLKDMLDKVKETCFEAYSYEDTPFGKVVEHVSPVRSLGIMPLFQYAFSFMNTPSRDLFLPNLELEIVDSHNRSAKFDINIVVVTPLEQAALEGMEETNKTIIVEWEYNSDIYADDVMNQMLDAYFDILEALVSSPETPYKQVSCVSVAQEKELLNILNNSQIDYPSDITVLDLFKNQVKKSPNGTAIVYEGKELTYQDLEDFSNMMANDLLSTQLVYKEVLIGVELERSDWFVISLLAILKTGAAYVPIDPSYPEQRINYIKEDSQCTFVITKEYIEELRQKQPNISEPKIEVTSNQLAYVIYTSGSTGRPKGVMIEHKSLTNLCFWHKNEYNLSENTKSTLYSSVAFDASVWEVFPYLCFGGSLFPISNNDIRLDTLRLSSFLTANQITHCYLPPKVIGELKNTLLPQGLKILSGGEALAVKYIEGCELYNNYGPTENTVVTTSYKVSKKDELPLPIGRPVANTDIFILDQQTNKLQPKGVIGELCISGAGLSRGYLNRPELTNKSFIVHPFKQGERLYKTGDLARLLPSGDIEFIGRKDAQVKIRGYRIELGEIEYALTSQEKISEAVVTIIEKKEEKHLVAYVKGKGILELEIVKQKLHSYLPSYMIPSYFAQIDEVPLTPNGKINKELLPKVELDEVREYVAPRNEIESKLVEIWQNLLDVEKIGVTDDFFDLGGHSLKVTQLINEVNKVLSSTVKVKEVFTNPTIAYLSEKIKRDKIVNIPNFPPRPYYPLSSSQQRLWVLSQFEGGNKAYNIPGVFEMEGNLNVEVLQQSFQYLLKRHESLRTRFVEIEEGVYQEVINEDALAFTIENKKVIKEDVKEIITSFYEEKFDLSQAPLLKSQLLQTGEDSYYLLFAIHHIIGDGWSMEVFTKELMYVYNQLLNKENIDLPTLRIQYKDYTLWLESDESQERLTIQGSYWQNKLAGELPVLELPSYKKRPLVKSYHGATKLYNFSKSFSDKLKTFNQSQGVTLYMSLLSGINGLFYRYTGLTDILLGGPIAGRSHSDLANQIGLYLNTLAIRTRFEGDDSFISLLAKQKVTLLEAYEHQEYPFSSIVDELGLQRDTSRSALFDVLVVLQNQQETAITLKDVNISPYNEVSRQVSQFDMTFSFSEVDSRLCLRLEYNTDIYEAFQIDELCEHLERFIESGIDFPNEKISNLGYLTSEEENELLYDFNDTDVDYPNNKTLVDLFREQVAKNPEAIAIVYENKQITYQELDSLSNAMANDLLGTGLIEKETFIGVELKRNDWLVVSLLAVLKTGSAYVPIDPLYPQERINYIKKDSECTFVITENYIEEFKRKEQNIHTPQVEIVNNQLAYVIYTSGSTGNPKGVMVEHRNASALINWSLKEFNTDSFDITYFSTSHCFDLSVYEVFYTLSAGKQIRVVENGLSIPNYLDIDKNILINTVPSVIESFIENNVDLSNVSILNMAGEIIPPRFTKLLPLTNLNVYNLYGPSEDTTYTTYYKINEESTSVIPIGTPIDNTQICILSNTNQLQPKGVIGELCISGAGLSRGYLNSLELTNEKFIKNPYKEGERLYKTGDLARWLPNGNLEFIGRKDTQVKIRGYRIELGEIERVLLENHSITQAVVSTVKDKQEKYLVAYLVGQEELELNEVKSFLGKYLPDYMIPNHFMQIPIIPLTPNGKVDKKSLEEVITKEALVDPYVAPSNEIEEKLVLIWQEVLGVEKVGITDNFFGLGGNSIKAVTIKNRIDKQFDITIQITTFFQEPIIQNISKIISVLSSQQSTNFDFNEEVEEITI
ncbi:Tyrocidine synthase 3 [Tenacibaculum sp. 190524A02b]|uniref:amino acid adenylation domain-containing protein n=1 Tax=Tenacibaculum vairaonense TaxID=3137860 RepID=UPI0032B13C80